MNMERIGKERARNIVQGKTPSELSNSQLIVNQDKPPESFEDSRQQQQQLGSQVDAGDACESDKLAIYRHPLFPLLAMLLDKCEWATCSHEGPSSQIFQNEIRSFLLHLGQDGKSLLSGIDDVDSLMVKAILVLKIHLLEIEKVNELCKDFCQRYIACLKGKLQTENMLGIFSSGCEDELTAISNDAQLNQLQGSLAILGQSSPSVSRVKTSSSTQNSTDISNLTTMTMSTDSNPSDSTNVFGSMDIPYKSPISGSTNSCLRTVPLASTSPSLPNKKSKRSILPKHATNTMKAWLFQHIAHPYPSEEEKRILAHQTDLSLLQVNNWFINARRRILQPMLDSSNSDNSCRTKKTKPNQARLAQRFWPESLVQTIQNGVTNPIFLQPAQQAVHLISTNELKDDGLPITVVSNSNQLVSTGVSLQYVQSDKLLTMLSCPTQALQQTDLATNVVGGGSGKSNITVTGQNISASVVDV